MINIIGKGVGEDLMKILLLKLDWFQNAVLFKGHNSQPERTPSAKARTVWSANSIMIVCHYN